MNDTDITFTPSELVLLNGERFASKGKLLDKTRLIHNGAEVVCSDLVKRVIAAAILGSEQRGVLRLEIRQKKGMLGLGKVNALYLEPAGSFSWPESTVEAELCRSLPALKANKGRNEVYNFVYDWMGSDSNDPWQQAIVLVQRGLAQRDLLETEQKKVLLVFNSYSYVFPQRTAGLLAREDSGPVQQAFDECARSRPEVWKMLLEQIGKAVKARTEQSDTNMDT